MSFHESFRLNDTDGFYTVMNIPIILSGGSSPGKLQCTLNTIDSNISELIPIPPPLTKINGQVFARFTGTNEDQQGQFQNNVSPSVVVSEASKPSTQVPDSNNGQVEISVVPSVTTLVETATVQVNSFPPEQTGLDGSNFGGPGGDLTDELNNNSLVVQASGAYKGRLVGSVILFIAGGVWLLSTVFTGMDF